MEKKLIYLASPYTHPFEAVLAQRFCAVARCAGWLMLHADVFVFSPIAMTHQIVKEMAHLPGLGMEWEFWAEFDGLMIGKCQEFWVYCAEGWASSVGVQAEIKIARTYNMTIRYVTDREDGGYTISDTIEDREELTNGPR